MTKTKPVKQTTKPKPAEPVKTKPAEPEPVKPEPAEPITKAPRTRLLNLPEGVITSVQAAELIGCSKEYVAKVARLRKLKCWRIGKHYRFKVSDVVAFKRRTKNKFQPTPQE